MKDNLNEFYSDRIESLTADIALLKRKNPFFLVSELCSFAILIVSLYFYFSDSFNILFLLSFFFFLVLYIAIRYYDRKNSDKIDRLSSVCNVYENELLYLKGEFSIFYDGEKYTDQHHPFSLDMDLFGKNSLFNRINRTVTNGGGDKLAYELETLPDDIQTVVDRQESIIELSSLDKWRVDFISSGSDINTSSVLASIKLSDKIRIPKFVSSVIYMVITFVLISLLSVTTILSIFTSLSADVPIMLGLLQLMFTLCATSKTLNDINRYVNRLHGELKIYVSLVRRVSEVDFKSHINREIYNSLFSDDRNALRSFEELSEILSGLDRRGNIIGLILFNSLFSSDYFLVRRFIDWRNTYGCKIKGWIDNISELDALVSMATFHFNHSELPMAEFEMSDSIVYDAKGLYHPFLGVNAVHNDFEIKDDTYYIITGANMAGKSTFLRSLGINYILAVNGMPAFAYSLKVSLFNLFTSMRTTDDLINGISYFNAELLRLQSLILSCKKAKRTLIILDEILKGTNSLDKLNGSKLFLEAISKLPVSGVIATHDLELSKMADEDGSRFKNYCFEIELSDSITYSYKITHGVARNQNATFLLKNILKEING